MQAGGLMTLTALDDVLIHRRTTQRAGAAVLGRRGRLVVGTDLRGTHVGEQRAVESVPPGLAGLSCVHK